MSPCYCCGGDLGYDPGNNPPFCDACRWCDYPRGCQVSVPGTCAIVFDASGRLIETEVRA